MTTTKADDLLRVLRGMVGNFPYPHQAAFFLDNPVRRMLENPADAIEAIGLAGDERVLELGPGPGFFSVEIARRLTGGRLDLFDLQPEMLAKARRKLERAGYPDIGTHTGDAGAPLPFDDASFDVAFLAEVIGEVPDKAACLGSLKRILKPGGLLVFHEEFPDPDRLSVAELRDLAEPAGFTLVDVTGNRWRDTVRFRS
ncbi:class I SAM-dependent methyltransferase [Mycobacterium sp. 134]|uniref:class I SAM-dependent methyltransferase n=1 Tax=Mycobacterium sp. 134 TaxID=3400425 RepID=UPI003AABA505